ncbi:MAG: hypothetical protein PUA77_01450 [Lachnospiraceae bacterium]|nr:hypothetical protein [Lachnospiraceae bacterium]
MYRELALVNRFLKDEPLETIQSVCTSTDIATLQQQCREIFVHPELLDYMVNIIQTTRNTPKIASGVSPRGTLAFVRAAQGYAMVCGRDFVTPEDIKTVALPVLAHRMTMNVSFDASSAARQAITDILGSVTVPTEDWTKH